MLYSIGKDSAVMLHLAKQGLLPGPLPFPLLHVDTTWKFRDMYALRDRSRRAGRRADRPQESGGAGARHQPVRPRPAAHRPVEDRGAEAGARQDGFDAAFGGARRDEEKSRAKERMFSFRDRNHRWDPKRQRPELWSLYNARKRKGESMRVFPLSNWTELDMWQYILREGIRRAALFRGAAADGGARRPDPDGR